MVQISYGPGDRAVFVTPLHQLSDLMTVSRCGGTFGFRMSVFMSKRAPVRVSTCIRV